MGQTLKQQLFDRTYAAEEDEFRIIERRLGWRAWLHRKLQRFQTWREDIVCQALPGGENFLDVGCGGGRLLFMAADKYAHLYGVDVSQVQIQRALARATSRPDGHRFHFRQVDADEGLPYPDDTFDALTCVSTLQVVYDPIGVLKEFHRVLAPSGTLVVEVPNSAWLPHRVDLLLGRFPTVSRADEHLYQGGILHHFVLNGLRRLVESQGFKTTRVLGSGLFARYRRWWLTLLSGDIILVARKT